MSIGDWALKPAQAHLTVTEVIECDEVESHFALGHRPALDGIRGVSILSVMAFNAHVSFVKGGYIGVSLFFVLSGFLITSLLVEEHQRTSRISLKNFYYRRALRLLPALSTLILCVALSAAIFQPRENAIRAWKGVLYALFYVANWAQIGDQARGIGPLSHVWSLSVEEQFYILWPMLLAILFRWNLKRPWMAALLVLLISASLARSIWLWQAGAQYLRLYFGSDTRAGELLAGCMAALFVHWKVWPQTESGRWALKLTASLGLGAILYAIFRLPDHSGSVYCGGLTLIALGTAIFILDAVVFPSALSRILTVRPLVWVGKVSYGLYLWHYPIFEALRRTLDGRVPRFIYLSMGFVASFLIATLSFYFLEKPFLRLKRRFSMHPTNDSNEIVENQSLRKHDDVKNDAAIYSGR